MELARELHSYPDLFGSATASISITFEQEEEHTLLPRDAHDLPKKLQLFYSWEEDLFRNLFEEIELYYRLQIIQEFATKLIENTEDINPKYAKLVNKHFWDLI